MGPARPTGRARWNAVRGKSTLCAVGPGTLPDGERDRTDTDPSCTCALGLEQ